MKKIGIIGAFGFKNLEHGGQPVKTREIYYAMCEKYGKENVCYVETLGEKNHIKLLFKTFLLMKNCNQVAMLPAQNGVKIFAPLLAFLNIFFKRKLFYFVVGGWLPEFAGKSESLKKSLLKFDFIFAETNSMTHRLNDIGLKNAKYFPNFREMKILSEQELVYNTKLPLKLCTFSRVLKEKGIGDAIKSVIDANSILKREAFSLDIYGIIDDSYKDEFDEIIKSSPSFITYKGLVSQSESIDTLKDYFALLFPTYYSGEGLAGTLIDALSAGVPVISTNWHYNCDVIENGKTGLIYDYKNKELLTKSLVYVASCADKFNSMKLSCLKEAEKYTREAAKKIFDKYLES